jgi:hypothetical protein
VGSNLSGELTDTIFRAEDHHKHLKQELLLSASGSNISYDSVLPHHYYVFSGLVSFSAGIPQYNFCSWNCLVE